MSELGSWLQDNGLGEYARAFDDARLGFNVLSQVSDEQLAALGMRVGDILRMRKLLRERVPAIGHDAEYRYVSIVFSDLENSTRMVNSMETEAFRRLLRGYQHQVKEAVERFDGKVLRVIGDGVMTIFGYPAAHEDDAERAVRAALRVRENLRERSDHFQQLAGEPISVRIGIATGLTIVGDEIGTWPDVEDAVAGFVAHLAARLQGEASSNGIVICSVTHGRTEGIFQVQDLGSRELKGFEEPVRIWRVLGESDSPPVAGEGANLTPFVGRSRDQELLRDRWRAIVSRGQVVLLDGEAGIGKSRLLQAFRRELNSDDFGWLRFQCAPYHVNTALYPVRRHLQHRAALESGDEDDARLAKLRGTIDEGTRDPKRTLRAFAYLLSLSHGDATLQALSPAELREQTFQAFLEQLALGCARKPVLLAFEDVHWIDPTSLELLQRVLERIDHLRLMMVLTFRPDTAAGTDVAAGVYTTLDEMARHPAVTSRMVNTLSSAESAALVGGVPRALELPANVRAEIVERSGGNPLVLEQLTRAVCESPELARFQHDGAISETELLGLIPDTLEASFSARLDRLPAGARALVKVAAAVGREFSYDLLAAIGEPHGDSSLQKHLQQLVDARLIHRSTTVRGERYVFPHALIQDAAYSRLLKETRESTHRRIATALEEHFSQRAEKEPELLAHHWTQAGENRKAIAYWTRAGERAALRSANVEARHHFRAALEGLQAEPTSVEYDELELELLIELAASSSAVEGYGAPGLAPIYERALELCLELGAQPERLTATAGLAAYHFVSGNLEKALELSRETLAQAQRAGDVAEHVESHRLLGEVLFYIGDLPASIHHLNQCIELYDPDAHGHLKYESGDDPAVSSMTYLSIAQWLLGYPDRSLRTMQQGLDLARKLDHAYTLAEAEFGAGWLYGLRRESDGAERHARESRQLCEEHRYQLYRGLSSVVLGWARAMGHDDPGGIDIIRGGIEDIRATEAATCLSCFLPWLAEGLARFGGHNEAGTTLAEAFEQANERFYHPERLRLHAELRSAVAADSAEVERELDEGMSAARASGMRSIELRCALSLADLLVRRNREADALTRLRPVYDWFSEGFDSPDLISARLLIERLEKAAS